MTPTCGYCGLASVLKRVNEPGYPYGHRDYGPTYTCTACSAWVGCHRGTLEPLGRLADSALRKAKIAAHAAFDPLWQQRMRLSSMAQRDARKAGYVWLAQQLGLSVAECHIGMMDLEMCTRVSTICLPYTRKVNATLDKFHKRTS